MKRSVPAPVYAVKFDVCVLGQLGFEQLNLLRWLQMKPLHAAAVRLNILAGRRWERIAVAPSAFQAGYRKAAKVAASTSAVFHSAVD
jgi:hypothetical protein